MTRLLIGFVSTILLWLLVSPLAHAQVPASGEDGYDLWLRYHEVADPDQLQQYRSNISSILVDGDSPTLGIVQDELQRGLDGLLGRSVPVVSEAGAGTIIVGTPDQSPTVSGAGFNEALSRIGPEGYLIRSTDVEGVPAIVVAANEDVGALYGTFHLLRTLQTHQDVGALDVVSTPHIERRVLNHWDNLDRFVERGYAGFSIWDWHKLPDYIDRRYTDYARANASLGINGTVPTNVNADATSLTPRFLEKTAALADHFRPYGIQVYLTARFSAPIEIGGMDTADPQDPNVQQWWDEKVSEIYEYIPDFGGFLVKADSEGQPGPHDYDRDHAEGANMLADALAPHGGIVMWRAFVYDDQVPVDRIKQAYDEFKPLDGKFRENVIIQVKNGPLDFQPREPFHPLFGGMPDTPVMMELQITKEYLGHATHLAYLSPLYREVLTADTYAKGPGSPVSSVIDGTLYDYELTGIAGVANIGTDRNWSGSHFNQANWYTFGRLAWDHSLSSEEMAEEWIRMTFSNEPGLIEPVREIMMMSREAVVNYTGPLGLHHLMAAGHHYGPGPWVDETWGGGRRADWTATYYHRADSTGIGFDRTETGSNALEQYHEPLQERWGDRETVPDSLLLWFHRVEWDETLDTGRTLWEELVHRYSEGVEMVREMQATWDSLEGMVDERRFHDVRAFLAIQEQEAKWWREASILYFQSFSDGSIPDEYETPEGTLEDYVTTRHRYVPGI